MRLELFRLLVKHAPEGLVAGELSQYLDIPSTNLSFHLKALVNSGLAHVEREGRFMRYKAHLAVMLDVVAYLTEECCTKDPEHCVRCRAASDVPPGILPQRLPAEGLGQ